MISRFIHEFGGPKLRIEQIDILSDIQAYVWAIVFDL